MCLIPFLVLIHPANDSGMPSDFSAEFHFHLAIARLLDPAKRVLEVNMAKSPSCYFGWASLSPQMNRAPVKQALGMTG